MAAITHTRRLRPRDHRNRRGDESHRHRECQPCSTRRRACRNAATGCSTPASRFPAARRPSRHHDANARRERTGCRPRRASAEIVAAHPRTALAGHARSSSTTPRTTSPSSTARRSGTGIAPFSAPRAPVIDPLVIDKAVDRYRKGKRTLEAAAAFYGVPLDDAHDAGADAIAAGRVAQAIAREHGAALPRNGRRTARAAGHLGRGAGRQLPAVHARQPRPRVHGRRLLAAALTISAH